MSVAPTVLVVAPHPDDEVLGCGGSILLHHNAGRVVHVLYLTSGERGSPYHTAEELGRVREAEATAAARNFSECGTEPHWVPTVLGYEVWAAIGKLVYFENITPVPDRKLMALAATAPKPAGTNGAGQASHVGPEAAYLTGWRGASTTGGHPLWPLL